MAWRGARKAPGRPRGRDRRNHLGRSGISGRRQGERRRHRGTPEETCRSRRTQRVRGPRRVGTGGPWGEPSRAVNPDAGTALLYDLTLVTRNVDDFSGIEGLTVLNP